MNDEEINLLKRERGELFKRLVDAASWIENIGRFPNHRESAQAILATIRPVLEDVSGRQSQRAEAAPEQAAPGVEPYGQVTTHKLTGQQFFFRWPDAPYLDNASECVTVYAKQAAPERSGPT